MQSYRALRSPRIELCGRHTLRVMQRPVEARDEIVGVLDPDADPDQPIDPRALDHIARREVLADGSMVVDLRREPVERQGVARDATRGENIGDMAMRLLVSALHAERDDG